MITAPRHWKRLLKPGFSDIFCTIFRRSSIRTLKSQVQSELTIPSQSRYVVGIEMGRIERYVYDEALQQALAELGLKHDVAVDPGWQPDVSLLRSWLRRLRAVATHPQVGQLDARDKILRGGGNLRTISEVLDVSCDYFVDWTSVDSLNRV